MPVGFDEAGQRDHAVSANDLSFRRGKILTDGDNHAVAHVNIAAANLAELGVHRKNVRVLHDELATFRKFSWRSSLGKTRACHRSCGTPGQSHSPKRCRCAQAQGGNEGGPKPLRRPPRGARRRGRHSSLPGSMHA